MEIGGLVGDGEPDPFAGLLDKDAVASSALDGVPVDGDRAGFRGDAFDRRRGEKGRGDAVFIAVTQGIFARFIQTADGVGIAFEVLDLGVGKGVLGRVGELVPFAAALDIDAVDRSAFDS